MTHSMVEQTCRIALIAVEAGTKGKMKKQEARLSRENTMRVKRVGFVYTISVSLQRVTVGCH